MALAQVSRSLPSTQRNGLPQAFRSRGLLRKAISRPSALQPQAFFKTLSAPFSRGASVTTPVKPNTFHRVSGDELLVEIDAHLQQTQTQHLLVMFSAEWCGPCVMVKSQLAKLMSQRPASTVKVLYADVDDCKELASNLGITSLPQLVFVGRQVDRPCITTVGPVSASLVADVLDNKMQICGSDLKRRLRLS